MDGQSFVEQVQNDSDKTANSFMTTKLVAYSMDAVMMTFTYSFRWWLVENIHSIMRYLPMKFIIERKVVRIFSESKSYTRYWFTGKAASEGGEHCCRERDDNSVSSSELTAGCS